MQFVITTTYKLNYKLFNATSSNTYVYNGWIGTLDSIDFNVGTATIYYPIIDDRIIYDFYTLKGHIILGYASTIHKFQGSSSKVVIGVLDYSTPPSMRTKELLYTLITRAETQCAVACQGGAFREAIETSGVLNKNTFLVELIEGNKNSREKTHTLCS